MAVAGDAFPPTHQPEPALGVEGTAGSVVLQHRGLEGPVAFLFGLGAQGLQQLEAQPPAPERLTYIDAYLGHAPVAPAGVHPVQGGPPGQHTVGQNDQPAFFGVGGIPGGVGWAIGLEGSVLGGNALQVDPGHGGPVFRLHVPDRDLIHLSIPKGSHNAPGFPKMAAIQPLSV